MISAPTVLFSVSPSKTSLEEIANDLCKTRKHVPLIDLVATILLEVSLNMTDQRDVHEDGCDQHQERERKHDYCENHSAQGDLFDDGGTVQDFVPLEEGRRLVPVHFAVKGLVKNRSIDDLARRIGEHQPFPV